MSDARRAGYPAGVHTIDLVVGGGDAAFAVHVGVHPDGVEHHIDRELALRRFGWETVEVFASRWADRHAELVLDLARRADHHSGT